MPQSGDYTANMVGALSSSPIQLKNEDLNNITNVGFYWAGGGQTTQNGPSEAGSAAFGMAVYRIATGFFRQVYWANYENKTFQRTGNGTSWESWVKIFDAENPPTSIALSPPINIGSASFDGSQSITLEQMGALPSAEPNLFVTATPNIGTDFSDASVKYSQIGNFVFVIGMATLNNPTKGAGLIVASGLPAPSSNYYGAHLAPISASSVAVANARIGGDGNLTTYFLDIPGNAKNIYFSGFYFAD